MFRRRAGRNGRGLGLGMGGVVRAEEGRGGIKGVGNEKNWNFRKV